MEAKVTSEATSQEKSLKDTAVAAAAAKDT